MKVAPKYADSVQSSTVHLRSPGPGGAGAGGHSGLAWPRRYWSWCKVLTCAPFHAVTSTRPTAWAWSWRSWVAFWRTAHFARIGPKTGTLTARDRAETAIQPRFPAGVTKTLPGGAESHPWPPCRSWNWGRWNAVTRLTVFHLWGPALAELVPVATPVWPGPPGPGAVEAAQPDQLWPRPTTRDKWNYRASSAREEMEGIPPHLRLFLRP